MGEGLDIGVGAAGIDLKGDFGAPRTGPEHRGSGGGFGGNGGGTVEVPLKDYVDAQDEKTRAQNDARFADIMAELRGIRESSVSWRGVWGAAGTTIAALTGIILGTLAIAGDRFDGGLSARSLLTPILERQEYRDAKQDQKLDRILEALEQKHDDSEVSPSVDID